MSNDAGSGGYSHYLTGEDIRVGDVVETYWGNGKIRGRIVKHFLPCCNDPDARNWNMEDGGIMIEFEDGSWIGYGPADDELFFVSHSTNWVS